MKERGFTGRVARRVYDRISGWYDLVDRFEGKARSRGLEILSGEVSGHVLDVGVGPGRELRVIERISGGGRAVGVDISPAMLALARKKSEAALVQADVIRLPFADGTFDGIFCAYVLDLLPHSSILFALRECRRVLAPGGKAVFVSMTEGFDLPSKVFVAVWNAVYDLSPSICAGCRPLVLEQYVGEAGFTVTRRELISDFGVASEVIAASNLRGIYATREAVQ